MKLIFYGKNSKQHLMQLLIDIITKRVRGINNCPWMTGEIKRDENKIFVNARIISRKQES